MSNREAARQILADDNATWIERHGALMLIAGAETNKAQDELIINQWGNHVETRAFSISQHYRFWRVYGNNARATRTGHAG